MNESSAACARMRALLLEVDPAQLDRPDSPIARHVRECDDCAAAVASIRTAQEQLANALSTLTAGAAPGHQRGDRARRTTLEAPVPGHQRRDGIWRDHGTAEAAAPGRRRGHDLWHDRRRMIAAAAPLAAAAMFLLVLTQQRSGDLPRLEPLDPISTHAIDMPIVNVTSGSDVAVMQTTNPNITVIWYLNRERQ